MKDHFVEFENGIFVQVLKKKKHCKPEFNLKYLRYNKITRKVKQWGSLSQSIRIETKKLKKKKGSKIHVFLNNKLTCDIKFKNRLNHTIVYKC